MFLPDRILVAPGDLGDTARAYGLQQREAGRKHATVVETIEQAHALPRAAASSSRLSAVA